MLKMDKSRFLKVYANLPEDVRREIIVVVDDKPYTWNAVYVEIETETKLGKEMITKLEKMEVI